MTSSEMPVINSNLHPHMPTLTFGGIPASCMAAKEDNLAS